MTRVEQILVVLGPPGSERLRQLTIEGAARSGKTPDELHCLMMSNVLTRFCAREDGRPSGLEDLLEEICHEPVVVDGPFVTYWFQDGVKHPAVRLNSSSVRTPSGGSPLQDADVVETLIDALVQLFQVEWANAHVVGEFQSLRAHKS